MSGEQHNVGEVFSLTMPGGETKRFILIESHRCYECDLRTHCVDAKGREPCTSSRRDDGKQVIFKEVVAILE